MLIFIFTFSILSSHQFSNLPQKRWSWTAWRLKKLLLHFERMRREGTISFSSIDLLPEGKRNKWVDWRSAVHSRLAKSFNLTSEFSLERTLNNKFQVLHFDTFYQGFHRRICWFLIFFFFFSVDANWV